MSEQTPSGKDQESASDSERQESTEDANVQKIVVAIEGIPKAYAAAYDQDQRQHRHEHAVEILKRRQERKRRRLDWAAVVGVWLAFFATIGQGIIFYCTLKTTHADNVAILNATDRPWVGINSPILEFQINKPGTITIPMYNFGHSPAIHMNARFWQFSVSGAGQTCPATQAGWANESPISTLVIFPNQTATSRLTLTQNVNQADIDVVKSGACVLKIAGRIDYIDAQRLPHFTTVRATYDISLSAFTADPDGNEAK